MKKRLDQDQKECMKLAKKVMQEIFDGVKSGQYTKEQGIGFLNEIKAMVKTH